MKLFILALSVSTPDIITIERFESNNENEILTVSAFDEFSTINIKYKINIFDSFEDILLDTEPSNTSFIIYDGCKYFFII
jgi:hypothetical protein